MESKTMNNRQILTKVKKYFKLGELVDKKVLARYGQAAWQFLDMDLLHSILVVRKGLGKPITINTARMQQRGLRHNKSAMVKKKTGIYLSAHCLGKAFDFDVKGMKAEQVRDWIVKNEDLFRCKIRLEHKLNGKPITWVHLDVYHLESNPKVLLFNV